MNIKIKKFILVALFISAALGPLPENAEAEERWGWNVRNAEIVGDDTSCGSGSNNYQLRFYDFGTNNPISLSNVDFAITDLGGNILRSVSGSAALTTPLCHNIETEVMRVVVSGEADYQDLAYAITGKFNPDDVHFSGKYVYSNIWLKSRSTSGYDYKHVYPYSGAGVMFTNVDPTYTFEVNIPNIYSATQTYRTELFIWDVLTSSSLSLPNNADYISSGSGNITIPARNLSDGVYQWSYYVNMNGASPAVSHCPKSGFGFWDGSLFVLDRVEPTINSVATSPTTLNPGDSFSITGDSIDTLAGLSNIKIYYNGSLVQTCNFSGPTTEKSCIYSGTYSGGAYSYYITAEDMAGNIATSTLPNMDLKINSSDGPVSSLTTGNSMTLTWTTSDADSCTAISGEGFSGTKPTSFSGNSMCDASTGVCQETLIVPSVSTSTYTLECTGAGGNSSDSVAINTVSPALPTVDLKINSSDGPLSLNQGDSMDIAWTTSDADSCEATSGDGFSGAKSVPSGSETINALFSSSYILECTGPGGTNSDTVQVDVSCTPSCGAWSDCDSSCGNQTRSCISDTCISYEESQSCPCGIIWKEVAP